MRMEKLSITKSASRLCILLTSLLLLGCQSTASQSTVSQFNLAEKNQPTRANPTAKPNTPESRLVPVSLKDKSAMATEKINGLTYNGQTLRFNALSNGCTSSEDFRIDTRIDTPIGTIGEDASCLITIIRTKPDLCKKATEPVSIEINWAKPENCLDLPLVNANPLLEDKPRDTSGMLPGAIK